MRSVVRPVFCVPGFCEANQIKYLHISTTRAFLRKSGFFFIASLSSLKGGLLVPIQRNKSLISDFSEQGFSGPASGFDPASGFSAATGFSSGSGFSGPATEFSSGSGFKNKSLGS